MQKKYREIFQFKQAAEIYLAASPDDDKFVYALKRMLKRVNDYIERYHERIEDLRVDFCSVDEKGRIVKDAQGGYMFSREDLKGFNAAVRKLFDSETTIEPYECKYPKEFEKDLREIFDGFIVAKA